MKTTFLISFLFCIGMLFGCKERADVSYVPCQSFDEFSMTKICSEKLVEPYLLVYHTKDTIKIIRTDMKKDTMVYINKGNYWYSSIRINYNYKLTGQILNTLNEWYNKLYGWDNLTKIQDWDYIDVYRYIMKQKIIELYVHHSNIDSINSVGQFPDHIVVNTPKYSSDFFLDFQIDDNLLETTTLKNTLLIQAYMNTPHKIRQTINKTNIYYNAIENMIYIGSDTIQLNSLMLYYVPTYAFSIEEGTCIKGYYNNELYTTISCTTLETDY